MGIRVYVLSVSQETPDKTVINVRTGCGEGHCASLCHLGSVGGGFDPVIYKAVRDLWSENTQV